MTRGRVVWVPFLSRSVAMRTRTETHGQTTVGVVEHEGREYRALGSSVQGRNVAAYEGKRGDLTTWDGRVMLACRSYTVETRRGVDGGETSVVVYLLAGGRAVVGYSLGRGMLFRGELVYANEDKDRAARAVADHCQQLDFDDYERDQYEQEQDDES